MEDKNICHEVNDAVPQTLDHFIGQEPIKARLKVVLEAVWNDAQRLPHCLCTGGPGLGKTEICHILAKEMGSEIKEVLAQNLKTPEDLNAFLLDSQDRDVLALDELHELSPLLQTSLYRAMENSTIFVNGANSKKPIAITLPGITILGCTTDSFRLLQPLQDRFKLVLPFEFYAVEELSLLLKNRCKQLNWQVDENVFPQIAVRGRGTPRIALRLLSSIRMTARAENSNFISMDHALRTFALESIDPRGCGPDEQKYMAILSESNTPTRLNIIASKLGLHPRNITMIENYLIRIGLITKVESGRTLTGAGLEYAKSQLRTFK